jgi:hypothetical protein
MADIKALARYNWKYVVVDEGHRLKNFECKLIRDLRMLPADNKLLLTGEGRGGGAAATVPLARTIAHVMAVGASAATAMFCGATASCCRHHDTCRNSRQAGDCWRLNCKCTSGCSCWCDSGDSLQLLCPVAADMQHMSIP